MSPFRRRSRSIATYDAADGVKPFANYAVNDFTRGENSIVALTANLTGDPSQVVNGTLTELNPKRGLLLLVR